MKKRILLATLFFGALMMSPQVFGGLWDKVKKTVKSAYKVVENPFEQAKKSAEAQAKKLKDIGDKVSSVGGAVVDAGVKIGNVTVAKIAESGEVTLQVAGKAGAVVLKSGQTMVNDAGMTLFNAGGVVWALVKEDLERFKECSEAVGTGMRYGVSTVIDETLKTVGSIDHIIKITSVSIAASSSELALQGKTPKLSLKGRFWGRDFNLNDIDVIAVTTKPGLPGSLLVGVCFAKALAWAKEKKIIGVNHLEAHIFSSCIDNQVPFPHLCIAASGGHTSLYLVRDFGVYECIGQTRDDAAGEAFDKVAKMLNLPYPGGPEIEKLAREAYFEDFFSYPRPKHLELDLSFSGLKTAVLYDLVARQAYDLKTKKLLTESLELKQHVASSLLVCVRDMLSTIIERALKSYPEIQAVTFVGGVACNKYLRQSLQETVAKHNKLFFAPAPKYCGDNGAMIAFVGHYKAQREEFSDLFLDILH